MTDRERRGLRSPVKTVVSESFDWDSKTGALPDKPSQRSELTFSPQGNLLQDVSQFQNGPVQRSTHFYDEAGRLREIRWRNPDGTEHSTELKYDANGEAIRGANVTYSSEKGRKIKTEVFEHPAGVDMAFGFEDGPTQVSWGIGNAALASTFYDEKGHPKEMVFYNAEHVQISKLVRTYDERGRVASEGQQSLSPDVFSDRRGGNGEEIPKEMAQLLARVFSKGSMRMIYEYDDQDRVVTQTQDSGLFGYEKTVSLYNEHGDLKKQLHYSTHRGDLQVDEEGNILAPLPAPEKLASETEFFYQYDDRGNWTSKKISTLSDPGSRWESLETRSITYY